MIGLYGAGNLGRQIGSLMKSDFCFVDDTPNKINTNLDGHFVFSLEDYISRYGNTKSELFICIYQQNFSHTRLKSRIHSLAPNIIVHPFTKLLLNQCYSALPFLFFEEISVFKEKLIRYQATRKSFSDELSRKIFDEHVELRLNGNLELIEITSRQDVPFLKKVLSPSVIYVDIGAYDGDTVEDFLSLSNNTFSNIHVIEPDLHNLSLAKNNLTKFYASKKIFFHQKALSSVAGMIGFSFNGSVNSKINLNSPFKVETLMLSDLDFEGQIYIKLDVEGEEINALKNSQNFLENKQPILAVSVYHNPDDLLDAVEIINRTCVGYSFYLRCHGFGGSDLMLYAIPAKYL